MFNLTTKNTTVLGILAILSALSQAAYAIFDGDVNTVVDFQALFTGFTAGVALIKVKVEEPALPGRAAPVPSDANPRP